MRVDSFRFAHATVCELICFARKHNLDAQLRQINPTGKNLSSHSRKNIPLPPQGKSAP